MELARLMDEKRLLDSRLDQAMGQYALFEEKLNPRLKDATGDERDALMRERAKVEEILGIVSIVERLDQLRDQINALKGA